MLIKNIHIYVEREGPNGEKSLQYKLYKTLALKLGSMLSLHFCQVKLFITFFWSQEIKEGHWCGTSSGAPWKWQGNVPFCGPISLKPQVLAVGHEMQGVLSVAAVLTFVASCACCPYIVLCASPSWYAVLQHTWIKGTVKKEFFFLEEKNTSFRPL